MWLVWHCIQFVLSCGCRCALQGYLSRNSDIFQYSIIPGILDQVYFFFFMYSYTIRNIPGSQYLEYVDPRNLLMVLYSFFKKLKNVRCEYDRVNG